MTQDQLPTKQPPKPIETELKFKLAEADDPAKFEALIEVMINDGWRLSGELTVTVLPQPSGHFVYGPPRLYTQCMLKEVRKGAAK